MASQITVLRDEQFSKAQCPIHTTLSGMVMELKEVQPAKTAGSMLATPSGIVTEVKDEQ